MNDTIVKKNKWEENHLNKMVIFIGCSELENKSDFQDRLKFFEAFCSLFAQKVENSLHSYLGDPNDDTGWGEKNVLYDMNYLPENGCLRIQKNGTMLINAGNIASAINACQYFIELKPLLNNSDYVADSTCFIRDLLSNYVFFENAEIRSRGQVTFCGERFWIADNAIETEESDASAVEQGIVRVVPFRYIKALSSVDSIRLIEKIERFLTDNMIGSHEPHTIRFAVFGEFSDKPSGDISLHHIERLAEDGYFGKNIHVKIDYFNPSFIGEIPYLEFCSATGNEKDSICGSLYDSAFWKRLYELYDMVLLLDMGCFYTDTSVFGDTFGGNSALALDRRLEMLRFHARHNRNDSRYSFSSLRSVYNAYLTWIESNFYGKTHSYEFDPKIIAALTDAAHDNECVKDTFLYMSYNRNRFTESILSGANVCKDELYNAVMVSVYDWKRYQLIEERRRLLVESFLSIPGKAILPVRLWKILKSIGDDIYTSAFLNIISNISDANDDIDYDFIRYVQEIRVVFDYSEMIYSNRRSISVYLTRISRHSSFSIDSAKEKRYALMIKNIIMAVMQLVFEENAFTECSSPFMKSVLFNAMSADSTCIEHLLLVDMLRTSFYKKSSVEIDEISWRSDCDISQECEGSSEYYLKQALIYHLGNAIKKINDTNQDRRSYAGDVIKSAFERIECEDLFHSDSVLNQINASLRRIEYRDCALFACTEE